MSQQATGKLATECGVFTALHRDEADFEKNKAESWLQGTEIALDQFVAHVNSMK